MRINQILLVIVAASLLSGILLHNVTSSQSSMAIITTGFLPALLGCAIATIWGLFKLNRGLATLNRLTVSTDAPANPQPTGITELDEFGRQLKQFRLKAESAADFDKNIKNELDEIKALLAQVDRRATPRDLDGRPVPAAELLRGILSGYGRELESNVQKVIACGREIGRCTEQMVAGADQQTDAVNRTTGHIEVLSSQIMAVGENAHSAVSSSATAQEVAHNGLQEFHELIDEMKSIRNHVAARERKLQTLGQHSKEIGSIVQAIGTLSSRTDLLALNASIESVRAGEHGRGFAIVAEEVRALAEQSAQAVSDITSRIELIQLETQESIAVASGEHDQMHQVINRITGTLDSLKQITESANSCSASVAEISGATEQQLRLMQDIVAALERTSKVSKDNRIQSEGVHWTSKTLGQIGNSLDGSLQLFRSSGAISKASRPPVEAPVTRPPSEVVSDGVAV